MTAAKSKAAASTKSMVCRRCGVCCTRYQAYVSPKEIERIAAFLEVSLEEWWTLYDDPRWKYSESHLIRQVNGDCAFLRHSEKGPASCAIYPVRPACCAQWEPGLEKKECREGMRLKKGDKPGRGS